MLFFLSTSMAASSMIAVQKSISPPETIASYPGSADAIASSPKASKLFIIRTYVLDSPNEPIVTSTRLPTLL